jgi:N-acetylated-alpha-linked acidic dipeptidase
MESRAAKCARRWSTYGYGLRADYERLAKAGVDVRGCIALAKYGRAYRGVKAQLAEEFGCVGALLVQRSEERRRRRRAGVARGPWKPDWDGQRGSILPIANAPGDPTTPRYASARKGEACERSHGQVDAMLPKIPCLPLGARHVRAIQANLAKNADGEALGPGPCEVELELDVPREMRTIRT